MHDLRLDEDALKRWVGMHWMRTSRGIETMPRAAETGNRSYLECGTANEHDKGLTTNFYKPSLGSKHLRTQIRGAHRSNRARLSSA